MRTSRTCNCPAPPEKVLPLNRGGKIGKSGQHNRQNVKDRSPPDGGNGKSVSESPKHTDLRPCTYIHFGLTRSRTAIAAVPTSAPTITVYASMKKIFGTNKTWM